MIRLLAALALALGSLVVFGSPAHACTCAALSPARSAELAEVVFTGEIVQTTGDPRRDAELVFAVDVDEVFKGEVAGTTDVATGAISASCGLGLLPEGKPLVFFAGTTKIAGKEDASGLLHTFLCDGTGPARPDVLAELTSALGEPAPPAGEQGEEPGDEPDVESAGGGSAGYDSTLELTFDEPDEDGDGVLLWPMLIGLFAVATGAAAYVARRTT